jgi:GNAT superfamily N-acetyltransferase
MTEHEAIRIVPVTGPGGKVIAPDALKEAERVHRQLRPALGEDYPARMADVFRDGAEMCVALRDGRVQGLAVFRVFENTHAGRRFYVDDLVTDEASRSTGLGAALLRYLEGEARRRGCKSIELESGVHRAGAHRFYFREEFSITSYSFRKELK